MIGSAAIYSAAAYSDIKTRHVSNLFWLAVLVWIFMTGTTILGLLGTVFLAIVAANAWMLTNIGGADLKALTLLPLAYPLLWPVTIAVAGGLSLIWMLGLQRDEIPFIAPLAIGCWVAVVMGFYTPVG